MYFDKTRADVIEFAWEEDESRASMVDRYAKPDRPETLMGWESRCKNLIPFGRFGRRGLRLEIVLPGQSRWSLFRQSCV